MKLINLIKKLGAFEPDGFPFISLYLNAEANEVGRENYQVWLKKEFSERGAEYKDNPSESERFSAMTERVADYLQNEAEASANGFAIFTSLGDGDFFEAVQMDIAFPDNVLYSLDRPHIFPLARAVWENPRYAVLWADTNKADIYVFGGENRIRAGDREDRVENIKNTVTNRTQVGGWSQSRFQRHVDNFHLQHAKEVVAEVEELMSEKDIDYLILCGDEATIMPILRPQLSKSIEGKVVATINMSQYDSVEDIHSTTLEAMGIERATRDKLQVERVFDAAGSAAGMGTLGLESTLRALANGQVQELVLISDFEAIDYAPAEVERILNEYAPGDDKSPVETMPIVRNPGEVADQLIIRALNSDAKIFFIKDALLLEKAGGVGSILRFNMNATASG